MSQPNAVTHQGKRRTAAQKAADEQREKEAKEASNKAVQESYQCIATMQAQMQADQDNARVDAPKPKCPRARQVGKAAKTSKTPDLTMDGGQAGAEIVATDKPVVAKGKGQKGRARQLAAGANVEYPASDEDLEEEPVAAKPQRKKTTKPLVRDAIEALNTGVVIESFDGSTKARDANIQKLQLDIPKQFSYSGRIPGWVSIVPANASKPSSVSKLTRGNTISSNGPPPSTPISIPDAGSTFSNLYASDVDEDEELFNKPLSGFTGKKALTFQPKLQITSKALDDVFPRGATSEPDPIEDAKHAEVPRDICDQIIFMNLDIGNITPPPQLAFLGDYKSNSNASHELQATDYDSDLVPPPLAQKPTSHSIFPVDYKLLAASQKQKQPPLLSDDGLLLLSSDDEIVEVTNDRMITTKAEPTSEPVSMHWLTSMTNIATTLKAPPAKRLKSESSTTTITGSHLAIATSPRQLHVLHSERSIFQRVVRWQTISLGRGLQRQDSTHGYSRQAHRPSAWDAVYKDKIPHTVTADGPVIALTLQRLSKWHNSISNVALIVLANFMISQEDLDTDQDHQDFASGLLENLCFLFGDISEDREMSRPFQSDLLVQVLVQHKCATSGTVNMPGINNTLLGHSKGALALITAVACIFFLLIQLTHPVFWMEHAIKLFANGQMLLSDIDTAGNCRNNKTLLHINLSMDQGLHHIYQPLAIYCIAELAHNLAMKRCGTWMEVDDQTEDE
ncbi:uncharacterized protein F5147DRAFT_656235 [Suillus discolor]|uniref:Uncharacterized protein n=1 Tax=Suillus discolor TaxID=1912936 RepID=A0A9P7F0C3_9AGAM|nr:uncharacterized protein F5147DRAFT_656235 [Suillus discolor]KAG2097999.1 hypothetical protein F5147DRAFT_656235 [Suillus discolor]